MMHGDGRWSHQDTRQPPGNRYGGGYWGVPHLAYGPGCWSVDRWVSKHPMFGTGWWNGWGDGFW